MAFVWYSCNLYIFIFTNKKPPSDTVASSLATHGLRSSLRCVRIDPCGELAESAAFRVCIATDGYTLENTYASTSFQNTIVERPYRKLADIMRTMLSGSNLTSDYWSHAIRQAIYIKHRLLHQALPGWITPFQAYTSHHLDLIHVRVFGSRVTVKQSRI